MRLHRLELTAFGPFAGTQRVDFDELSAGGLFLLHGPTGAGKTSVLDGVCYALYGQVPGARPANRLRSDHAASGTATEVVLELTVGGRRLEITRRPEQARAKKRGAGTTVDKAVTLLREHVGGEWRGVSKSHQEIGEEVRQLVGMSCEQFCQVVLLPQGEFATFLRASAVERAALLGRLFDTGRFKAVEQWLRDRRHEAERRLAAGDEELRQLAARIRQAAGDSGAAPDPDADADADADTDTDSELSGPGSEPGLDASVLAEAAIARCDARERYDIAGSAMHLAEEVHRAAAEAAATAREVAALQGRHREALERESAAARQRPARAAVRARLDRARRAFAVDPALGLHDKAAARYAEALAAEREAAAGLAAAGELVALATAEAIGPPRPADDSLASEDAGHAPTSPDEAAGHLAAAAEQGCDTDPSPRPDGLPAQRGGPPPAASGTTGQASESDAAVTSPRTEAGGAHGRSGGPDARAAVTPQRAEELGPEARAEANAGAKAASGGAYGRAGGANARAAVSAEMAEELGPDDGPDSGPEDDDLDGDPDVRTGGAGGMTPVPLDATSGAPAGGPESSAGGAVGAASGAGGDGVAARGGSYAGGSESSAGGAQGAEPRARTGRGRGSGAAAGQRGDVAPGMRADGMAEGAQGGAGGGGVGVGRSRVRLVAEVVARRVGELREELGGLAGAGEAEARLNEIGRRREELARQERDDEDAVRDAQAWLEDWAGERGRLQARVDAAGEAAARAAGLAGEVEAARARRDAAAERDRLARETARAQEAARAARDRAAEAREAWQDAREARIAGMAAELADALVDGEPCRVCGAEQHPAPARPEAARRVTSADEDAANTAYEQCRSAYASAGEAAARLHAALDAASAAAGTAPYAELAARYEESAAQHAAAVRGAGDLTAARGALARAEEERDRRNAQREEALSSTAARTSRREELEEQHQRLTAELARTRAGHATVQARHAHLTARIALLERAVDAARERADGEQRLAEAGAALAAAAEAAGFGSAAEATAALLPATELTRAEREVAAWAREEAAIEAALAAPEPAAAAALPPADPDSAQRTAESAHRRLRDASSAESAAATRCRELDRLTAVAAARVRELAPARAEFTRLKRLAEVAAGNSAENQYRMELETYVLAARLEQVAAAAGVRLQRMSAGRYTLVHSDARAGKRAKSGLGLMVVDAWTGTERDTATLSGGETFFASLALALGLADVVTDEAGGIRLDTLFIDEGFGSLDDQTLDEVLDVLDGLRERDRAVGIVSHVADLRHRIPAQLRVFKDRDGSSVRLHTATG